MSTKSRKAAKEKRLSLKRGDRERMKKQYQAWAADGANSISKRFKLATRRIRKIKVNSHPHGPCGNPGCKIDFPQYDSKHPNIGTAKKKFSTSKLTLAYNQRKKLQATKYTHSRSPQQRLLQLDQKFGVNQGAQKERNKLQQLIKNNNVENRTPTIV